MEDVEALLEASSKGNGHSKMDVDTPDDRDSVNDKKSNGRDKNRDRDATPSSRSSRSHRRRSRSRDRRDRDRSKDRRDHDRDRDRERSRRHRSRSPREKGGDKDRDRSREKKRREREKEKEERRRKSSRSRSRERRERYETNEEKDREKEREREEKRRKRYEEAEGEERQERKRMRRSPSYDEYNKKSRSPSKDKGPRLTEEEHEMRSVFVSQLAARIGDRELRQFFEAKAGPVRDARVITDRISRRSKGVGYVEFIDVETVNKALALAGTTVMGVPILVSLTEAEKNRQAAVAAANPANFNPVLYVGSLNFQLTEDDIRQVFEPFGAVDHVDLHKDPVLQKSKGFAFVHFRKPEDAKLAMDRMNGFELAGREIKVGPVSEKPSTTHPAAFRNESLDEGTGGNLSGIGRFELMQKLAKADRPAIDIPQGPMLRPNIPVATSRSMTVKNAFRPDEETQKDWHIDLRDDFKDELENKYGPVAEIFINKDSMEGEILIKFQDIEVAKKALEGLNGRWFGGRQLTAGFISDAMFDASKRS